MGKLLDLKKNKINQKKNQSIKISITKEKNQGCLAFGSCLITGFDQESGKWYAVADDRRDAKAIEINRGD